MQTIKEFYEKSIEHELTDLTALLTFLLFEKQVLSLDDEVEKLDLYFLEKHNDRMNKELSEFKQRMKITYPPTVYLVDGTKLVKAMNEQDALVKTGGTTAEIVVDEYLFVGDKKVKVRELAT